MVAEGYERRRAPGSCIGADDIAINRHHADFDLPRAGPVLASSAFSMDDLVGAVPRLQLRPVPLPGKDHPTADPETHSICDTLTTH